MASGIYAASRCPNFLSPESFVSLPPRQMSLSTATSDRSGIWSYLSFGSLSRRRSVSAGLPKANNTAPWESFEKSGRRTKFNNPVLNLLHVAWMTPSRQTRWIKAGGILSFIILLYYFLAGGSNVSNIQPSKNAYTSEISPTTKCASPHDASKPLVQYAIMIDAGSTGSRIHVYKFNNCGPTPELEFEEFKMTGKKEGGSGLSSYKTDVEGAAKSLDPLMELALAKVPDGYKSCTPIAVKATAGLRLLGDELSGKILEAVRHRLETVYPFAVVSKEKDGVVILPGEQEGVYAWITTNYLLGNIGGPDKLPTAATFDLGGGSTQIVFEPTFSDATGGKMEEGDHKYSLKFGGRDFELYQHSHLGYGLMEARKSLHRSLLEDLHKSNPSDSSWLNKPIVNPCIAAGQSRKIEVVFPDGHELGPKQSVTMEGPKEPLPAECKALAEGILYKEKACALTPCSFNGIHQPSLQETFAHEDVYIFSYFYDRTKHLGMHNSFTIRELYEITEKVCGGEDTWGTFHGVHGALQELRGRPEWCLDLNFMAALLHKGYELPMEREVKIAKKIKGNELGWCLGASLPLLEKNSGWECRIKQVN